MPHTSLTKSKADTLGLFLRKVAASASRTICDFGTRRCRAVAFRCALILSGILQVIVIMPFDNTELHIEQYLNHLIALHLFRCAVRHHHLVPLRSYDSAKKLPLFISKTRGTRAPVQSFRLALRSVGRRAVDREASQL